MEWSRRRSAGTILIAGPPNGGKSTQCKMLLEKYGLIWISCGDLLRARQKFMPELAKYMDNGALVPDEMVCSIVSARLMEKDCEKGVLLDGFPRTRRQAEVLGDLGINVSHLIVINVAEENIYERVLGRRIDPVSGRIYNINLGPPRDEAIAKRLITRPDDTLEKIKKRLKMYNDNITQIVDFYGERTQTVSGDHHPDLVFDQIRDIIEGDLYWGCVITRPMSVRSYECSPALHIGSTSDLITVQRFFDHMIWLMLGRGVLGDLRHPLSFKQGGIKVEFQNISFSIRAQHVELKQALVPGLNTHVKVWLEKVSSRSVVLGHTVVTTRADVAECQKLLVITGQQRRYLEMLQNVVLMTNEDDDAEIEIATGFTVLVSIDAQNKMMTIPRQKWLRNLAKTSKLLQPRIEQMEACPRNALSKEWTIHPQDLSAIGSISLSTIVYNVENVRHQAEVELNLHHAGVIANNVISSLVPKPCKIWIENFVHGAVQAGHLVTMRVWTLSKPPKLKGNEHHLPISKDEEFIAFEILDKMNKKTILRGCQIVQRATVNNNTLPPSRM